MELANYLFLLIRQDEPVSLASRRSIVKLNSSLSDLLTREEHGLLIEDEIQLLHIVLEIFILLLLLDVL
jgi:hypothetical protein